MVDLLQGEHVALQVHLMIALFVALQHPHHGQVLIGVHLEHHRHNEVGVHVLHVDRTDGFI